MVPYACDTNDAPDIFATDAPFIASYVEMGVLEPLDGYWDPADFADVFPAYQNAVTYQGKIYAAPLSDNTNVLFYNTEMFESAGITAPTTMEDAWTWNQLIENAQKLTQKDASGNITVYGIMPTMYPPTDTSSGMSFTILPWLWSGGGEILSPDVTTADGYIDSPETRAVLEFWNDLYNTYEVAPTINMSDPFISGQVAMWMTGVNNIATWKNNLPDFYKSGKWSAMPGPKGTAGIVTVNGSWNLSMSANCPDKQAAWNLINAVSGKDGMAELMKEWGRMPARQSTLDTLSDYYSGPGWDVMKMQTSTARARYLSPVYPQISDAVIEMFNAVAYGEDIDKAIAAAKQTLNNAVS